ncbi:glycosyltransferase [Plastorhodobacter daqingensis]|uniref:Glycosyltransferase n=1 Tax=Plastorhodobacter daqingensis TaxID=1387281 RepID=A0ABW2UIT9_9RHOB
MGALGRNMTAQGYSQGVTLAVQLGSVPLLIGAWGLERYGVWLLLTAVPAYLAFCDFGFTFVAKNEMSMQVARGDRDGAQRVYQSVFLLLLLVSGALLAALLPLVWLLPLAALFNLGADSEATARQVLTLQIGGVLLYQFFLLSCAGLRCEGRAATEAGLAATARLAEAAAVLTAALTGAGLVPAAVAGFLARVGALVVTRLWLRQVAPWLRLGVRQAQAEQLRALAGPSLSYMAVPLGHALLLHAPVILLGAVAQPAVIALYSVTRTVARLGIAGGNMLVQAFTPEYSRAFGQRDAARFQTLTRRHLQAAFAGTALYLFLAPVVLPAGVAYLSRGTLVAEPWLAGLLVAAVVAEIGWTTAFSAVAAVNAHRHVARWFLTAALLAMAIAVVDPQPVRLALLVLVAHMATVLPAVVALRSTGRGLTPDRGLRILFLALSTYSGTGGLQRFNQRLVTSLMRQAEAEAWHLRLFLRGDRAEDIPPHLRPLARTLRPGTLLTFLACAAKSDVLLIGHVNLLPLAWLAKRLRPGLRLVLFAHGVEVWGEPAFRRRRFGEGLMLRSVTHIAAVSHHTAGRMAQAYGLAPGRFRIFPNTIDLPDVPRPEKEGRDGFLTVTRLGAHDREKHVDQVLRALALLPEGKLEIVGDGPLRPGLERLAQDLGLSARVCFHGRVPDARLAELYDAAQAFVLPSSKEGFGIVYLEAWAHGLPVICSNAGAAPEIVHDGRDGLIVDPADTAQLAACMRRLAQDHACARRLAHAGLRKIRGTYLGENLDKNLRQLLKEGG